ncbi:hypothetical protein [Streptomyces sp. NRRL B-24484]|uniref:hypothetical protein n=1 Tax=Streptomyces sp. NRRL B-24484 TaxID=1463833 RepID=UPI0004BEC8B1|nr:hypothetical protein [Streptomyces sp. NRRL B-24484]
MIQLFRKQRRTVKVPAEVADRFGEAFGQIAAGDIAELLTCGELNALADVMRSLGYPGRAEMWTEAHAQGDAEGDSH